MWEEVILSFIDILEIHGIKITITHVRWIESDVNNPCYVYAAIEAGALVQSHDGGRTWIDRVEGGRSNTIICIS